jgi:DNA-binding phage protein
LGMAKDRATVSDQLREAIRRDGRTLYRLALDSGVNHTILERFMRAERCMTLDTAGKVCKVLGLRLQQVKKGSE